MSTAGERKFINIRKRLDQLGYRQPLGIESLPLVERLFSDLLHTTESLRNAKLSVGKNEKENKNVDAYLEPFQAENARLVEENNVLHLSLLKAKEEKEKFSKDLKATIRKLEHETADLKFLNNQYVHKVKSLEKDSKAKAEKIQLLQEKNLQAIVQTPGGKKRTIPFRRQRMQIDQVVPPFSGSFMPVPQPEDPYVADLLQVADNRIQELQQELSRVKQELERSDAGIRHLNVQVQERDKEIERLGRALHGGRPHDVISLEARNKSNEKMIAHLNVQIEFLQKSNHELEKRIQELQEKKHNSTSEIANLSAKNEELCQELTEIDQLAQQLERDKNIVLEAADQELEEAKKEIQRQHRELEDYEDIVSKIKMELSGCQQENSKLQNDLLESKEQNQKLECLLNQFEQEKQRLMDKVENISVSEKELVLEMEKMRLQFGVSKRDKSPSRLDSFVKNLEEDRDFYKSQVDYLQRTVRAGRSPLRGLKAGRSPSVSPAKINYEVDLIQVIRERDELQSMLDHIEKRMMEIQSKVKILTGEKENLSILYEQAQEELSRLRMESIRSPKSQKSAVSTEVIFHRVEDERDEAVAGLQRIAAERDSLKERLKAVQELATTDRSQYEKRLSEMENTIRELEKAKYHLNCELTTLKLNKSAFQDEIRSQSSKLAQTADEATHYKMELSSLRLLKEQTEQSLSDVQHRLSGKVIELQNAEDQISELKVQIDNLARHESSQNENINLLRKTIEVLDKEKDHLQETVDKKTEKIAFLEETIATKEKMLSDNQHKVSELESLIDQFKDSLNDRLREIASLRRQLDAVHKELSDVGSFREITLRENRRLQDDLATMSMENQRIRTEMEEAMHEKDELKLRVQTYITEVARIQNLMALKEKENLDLLEQFRMAHSQVEDWEVKLQQIEGQNSSIKLELLSTDTERRHLRERVNNLEKEINEHMNAQQAYETQISLLTRNMAKLEEELKKADADKSSIILDLASVRELCVKLDSNKDMLSRQLNSKNMELERLLEELEGVKSEAEHLKNKLFSEELTVKNLETLLLRNREKEFQSHLSTHEKESEITLLRNRLTLADSKTVSQTRETGQLRSKVTQLQTEVDVLKRQLTTEKFERERAIQEMKRQGLSLSSFRSSSPLSSSFSPNIHSPDRSILKTPDYSSEKSGEKSVSFKE
ncbi:centrosomal protein of 135 kDa [Polypterus senegalus]|uniref:centrosomal protein of 135 kDa n=1 Tax=Polypterus senegalus TaxID=55291 RepID=UPI001965F5BE|nr:centrosomal protein of 135 kDa [Polypterus senegalus]XP_039606821.1 centrosomal protein of 135 kDa [Polypterus senegalus]